jgi:hypothetical protein
MPTYWLFGVQVWIPDYGDLVNAVTAPLQRMVSDVLSGIAVQVTPLLQNLLSQIIAALKPILDPIWNFLLSLATRVYELLKPLLDPIWQFLYGLAIQIWNFIKPGLDQLWNFIKPGLERMWAYLQSMAAGVWGYLKPWYDALISLLHGDFRPLIVLTLDTANAALNLLSTSYPVLLLSFLGLQTGIEALKALTLGQPVQFEQILAAKLNEVLNPLGTLAADIWKNFQIFYKDVIAPALADIASWIDTQLKGLGGMVIDFIHSIVSGPPEEALERFVAVAAILGPLVTAINVGAQALELLHPIKNMGLVGTVTSCLDALGVTKFADAAFALVVAGALEKPIRQGLAYRYRPDIPSLQLTDTMLFQQGLAVEEWRRIYALHGWSESYISSWYASMWTEPSDRMIVGMVEGGEIEFEWLQDKLLKRGYRPEDAARILRYGTRKALGNEIAAIISEIYSDLQAGQIDVMEAQEELREVGVRDKELEFRIYAMQRRMKRLDVKDKIDLLTAQVKNYDITVEQYRNELIALGLRTARVATLVEKEEIRRKPYVKPKKERTRELAVSFYVRLFIEDAIMTEEQLLTYLSQLEPPFSPEDLELLVEDAKIRKAKAMAAAA